MRGALLAVVVLASGVLAIHPAAAVTDLDGCLATHALPRVSRVLDEAGKARFVRVVADRAGVPTAVVPLGPAELGLADALARAATFQPAEAVEPWRIEDPTRVCAPLDLRQADIDAEEAVVVAAGLNYAAHAEEAGGGDVFLFPKPAAPTRPYGLVPQHADVNLLDYEVELGFVLLRDIPLGELPGRDGLPQDVAFFLANDISDRGPIILQKAFTGPGTGFTQGKGRPGYLPTGPWLVRGSELFQALSACGGEGLGIHLEVDEGDGFVSRQSSSTARMIFDPLALLERIGAQVEAHGLRSDMAISGDGGPRHYPFAVDDAAPRLPAGSVVLTGTPDGVALQAPDPLPLVLRGLVRLRSPFAQFEREELERAAAGAPGGYLAPGDVVRAGIDGLGTQRFRIADNANPPDPCRAPERRSRAASDGGT